jgi:syntaxin-binding protein 5
MDRARRKLVSAIDGIRNLHTRADDGDSEDGGCLEEFAEEARASSDEDQNELEIEERIRSEHTTLAKIVRHGFQREARCMAFDPVQRLLAIGAAHGDVRLLGQAGVDYHLEHASDERVEFIQFLVNEVGFSPVQNC